MPTTLILYFMFQEKDFKVITWVSIKYCEFSPFYKIKLSIFTLYGNQMNRISLKYLISLKDKMLILDGEAEDELTNWLKWGLPYLVVQLAFCFTVNKYHH